jgi:hypothetical protein
MKLRYWLLTAAILAGCSDEPQPPPVATQDKSPAVKPDLHSQTDIRQFNAEALSPYEEKRIIDLAKNQRTADGSTVEQTVKYAEKHSNGRFKVSQFETIYNHDGSLSGVGMGYWIGASHKPDDAFVDVSWELAKDRQSFLTTKEKNSSISDEEIAELTVSHLMEGKETFLQFVQNAEQLY